VKIVIEFQCEPADETQATLIREEVRGHMNQMIQVLRDSGVLGASVAIRTSR